MIKFVLDECGSELRDKDQKIIKDSIENIKTVDNLYNLLNKLSEPIMISTSNSHGQAIKIGHPLDY